VYAPLNVVLLYRHIGTGWRLVVLTDGNACTKDNGGDCDHGCPDKTPTDCDDSVDCTDDSCDPNIGCQSIPNDNNCQNNQVCSSSLGCVECLQDSHCDDNVACTDNICDSENVCQYIPNDNNCDDHVACTDDSCNPVMGCQNTANDNNCPGDQVCSSSLGCVDCLQDSDCDDNVACTDDSCDSANVCQYIPNDNNCQYSQWCHPSLGCVECLDNSHCDEGDYCNGKETCNVAAGTCLAGTAPSCQPHMVCDETLDQCAFNFANGFDCNDHPFNITGVSSGSGVYPEYVPLQQGTCYLRLTPDSRVAFLSYMLDDTVKMEFSLNFGMTFVIHQDRQGIHALGGAGGYLGVYAYSSNPSIKPSLVVELDTCKYGQDHSSLTL